MSFTVAIDGPAAAGKGTIARAVADNFGFCHLDTGLLYRAVGAKVLGGADPVKVAQTLLPADLEVEGLRSAAVADAASQVAALPDVRAALLTFQRRFARLGDGAVLDGRDIGTVICPEAEVKLFVTARADIRAKRRWAELSQAGAKTEFADVLADVKARDARDAGRADAPMRAAEDAVLIDTSEMQIADAVAVALAHVSAVRGGSASGV